MLTKRLLDVLFAGVGLILSLPLMALVAVLIKATSRGPVIYSQVRIGRLGKEFRIHKFRSMVAEADTLGSSVTTRTDPRVTSIGRVLRESKLDELPQLWNVLRGDMSLVGPRPDVPEIVAEYTPAMRKILDVAPGMTSIASLELRSEEELLSECAEPELAYRAVMVPYKVELAMEHVVRRSTWYDLWVLLKTAWVLSVGRFQSDRESAVVAEARLRLRAFRSSRVPTCSGASSGPPIS